MRTRKQLFYQSYKTWVKNNFSFFFIRRLKVSSFTLVVLTKPQSPKKDSIIGKMQFFGAVFILILVKPLYHFFSILEGSVF